jgi:predicted regulator of Ras-like GTPase activity (Roadblock/LC7/MglB family)
MVDEGDFVGAVLATADGLPIASASSREEAEVTSAMVAMLSRVSREAKKQLGMADVDEVVIRDRDRYRLVCRTLSVGEEELLLAVRVPARRYHRRATNRAMRRIQRAWQRW